MKSRQGKLQQEKSKFTMAERLESLAYRLLGKRIASLLPLFKDLDLHLDRAGLKTNFKVYVSLAVFSTVLVALLTLAVVPSALFYIFHVPLFPAVLFGVGGSLFSTAFSVVGFYVYPVYRADKHRRNIEDELAFTSGYMAILASAGVSPEKIFQSLSNLPIPLAISEEAKNVIRNVNLFGLDIISALERTSKHTPSERFREMIEGLIATIHSGSSLSAYLREKSRQYMKLKRMSLQRFSDTLSTLAEFYVAMLVTGPLLLVIMLAVMAMMGGGTIWFLTPDLLLNILTYVGIPIGSIMFLIILDAISPKW
ncbi:MAG: type II secretion system F family protein [Nitrososphaerota archaeon]|nr:type II secretion system F family protein [Candidatus Bathyarchaeota archaeon]MDW8022139.1 type II secretion system F family protein [Nitrososphaerota archaeon]